MRWSFVTRIEKKLESKQTGTEFGEVRHDADGNAMKTLEILVNRPGGLLAVIDAFNGCL